VHGYYHLFVVIVVWVICLTRWITLAPRSSSAFPTLVCFLVFYRLTGKHLTLLTNMVSKFKSYSEAPHLEPTCGTHWSDSPIRAL
jgi:hypothetical protein